MANPVANPFSALHAALVRAGEPERNVGIFMRLRGIDGGRLSSLREIAAIERLSAERIRQIVLQVSRVLEALPARELREIRGATKRMLADVCRLAPGASSAIASVLGLPAASIPVSLVRLAGVLALPLAHAIDTWGHEEVIVEAGAPRCFNIVRTTARKVANASGAVSVGAVMEILSLRYGVAVPASLVAAMLATFMKDAGQVAGDRWFYESVESSNEIVQRARQRIGSLGSTTLSALCSADSSFITRSQYLILVPRKVMAAVMGEHGFLLRRDTLTLPGNARTDLPRLSNIQERMVTILQQLGGRARKTDFFRACVNDNINPVTVRAYMARSGIFNCGGKDCSLRT